MQDLTPTNCSDSRPDPKIVFMPHEHNHHICYFQKFLHPPFTKYTMAQYVHQIARIDILIDKLALLHLLDFKNP